MYIVLHLLNHNVDIVIQRNYLNITETIKEYSRYFRTFILVLLLTLRHCYLVHLILMCWF